MARAYAGGERPPKVKIFFRASRGENKFRVYSFKKMVSAFAEREEGREIRPPQKKSLGLVVSVPICLFFMLCSRIKRSA